MKPICERIGRIVRERREGKRLSLEALALRLDMSKTGVWQIEKGMSEPGAGTILRLCRVLGMSADYLLGVNEEEGA